jgi:hypothetical protein
MWEYPEIGFSHEKSEKFQFWLTLDKQNAMFEKLQDLCRVKNVGVMFSSASLVFYLFFINTPGLF